jgi:Uncharacterized protein conserved in bacteria (DUF2252)
MPSSSRTILETTRRYEAWLRRQTDVVESDLRTKHRKMAQDPFTFLRATFYRWLELWPQLCESLTDAPTVLAVGDLHVENFGTWRDEEGRLIWGINDVDDACELPYLQDLVRLATSAQLALQAGHLDVPQRDACEAVIDGYRASLEKGGRPIVLAERHAWLREIAVAELRDPTGFWAELQNLPSKTTSAPHELRAALPKGATQITTVARAAGVGSLGRRRFASLASVGAAFVARESKALAPSALVFLSGNQEDPLVRAKLIQKAVRVPDPFLSFHNKWIIRRLAPDCLKVELGQFPTRRQDERLLRSMGWETANMHLATGKPQKLLKDLDRRPKRWLREAVSAMADAVRKDWKIWKDHAQKS